MSTDLPSHTSTSALALIHRQWDVVLRCYHILGKTLWRERRNPLRVRPRGQPSRRTCSEEQTGLYRLLLNEQNTLMAVNACVFFLL